MLQIILACSTNPGYNITFGKGGNAEKYQKGGWSGPEEGFTWTDGKSATLLIPIGPPKSDIIMNLSIYTPLVVPGKLENQRVIINVNGRKVVEWIITDAGEYNIKIPKDYIKGYFLNVGFELPDAARPIDLGINTDTRELALAIKTIKLSEN
jgi:hypothetical protein